MKKLTASFCATALIFSLVACSEGDDVSPSGAGEQRAAESTGVGEFQIDTPEMLSVSVTDASETQETATPETGTQPQEPPHVIQFEDLAAFAELRDAVNCGDERKFNALAENISSGLLLGMDDVRGYFDVIGNVSIPVLDNVALAAQLPLPNFELVPERDYLSISYGTAEDKFVVFTVFFNIESANISRTENTRLFHVCDERIEYYICEPELLINGKSIFLFEVERYIVQADAWRYESNEAALRDIQEFSFIKLGLV
jgi:hypothetical protein